MAEILKTFGQLTAGKDIIRFHAAIWPAMLLCGLSLPLPKKLYVHGFIKCEWQKNEQKPGNVVAPSEII
jgi:methionyl-tRNA synthetase